MKQILITNIHSRVDLITNSSSEIFIGGSDRTVDEVKTLLLHLLDTYNRLMNTSQAFDEVFGNIYIAKENSTDEDYGYKIKKGQLVIESSGDNAIPYSLFEIIEEAFNAERHHLG
jgi:hypothetical protein